MKPVLLLLLISTFHTGYCQLNTNSKGVAVDGYDLLEYFNGEAIKGVSELKHQYKGVTYYFSSNNNLQQFVAKPNKYLPQYGGWCAYAMGTSGERVEIDPETFEVRNDKLYLFYNKYFTNTYKKWLDENPEKLRLEADKNWHDLQLIDN